MSDYDIFMADLRTMIKTMFTHALAGAEQDSVVAGTSNPPRIIPVDLIDINTPNGRLIHLNKMLSILPIGNSGLSVKIYAFYAFDEIENTIYYIPN